MNWKVESCANYFNTLQMGGDKNIKLFDTFQMEHTKYNLAHNHKMNRYNVWWYLYVISVYVGCFKIMDKKETQKV